jgi:integrase/recombinase XerC
MNGAAILKRFLADKSELTAAAYSDDLEDLRLFLKTSSVAATIQKLFGSSHPRAQRLIADYLSSMRRRGLAPATINRRLSTLRSLSKRVCILGYCSWMLAANNVKMEKVRDTRGPGRENIVKMFAFLTGQPASKPVLRDLAIIHLCYDLGLRRGEIVSLNLSDLVEGGLRVRRKGKVSKEPLMVPKGTRAALDAWLVVRGPQAGAMFINFDEIHRSKTGKRLTGAAIYQIVKARAQEAGVKPPVRPHGIRHTAITDARVATSKMGLGLDSLVDFSGHADFRTLKHYLDDKQSAQGAISAAIALP